MHRKLKTNIGAFVAGLEMILPLGEVDCDDRSKTKGVDREIRLPVLLTTDVIASIHNQRKATCPPKPWSCHSIVACRLAKGDSVVVFATVGIQNILCLARRANTFFTTGFSRSLTLAQNDIEFLTGLDSKNVNIADFVFLNPNIKNNPWILILVRSCVC